MKPHVKLEFDKGRFNRALQIAQQAFVDALCTEYGINVVGINPAADFRFGTASRSMAEQILRANYVVKV